MRGFSGPQAAGIGDPRIAALRPINAQGGLEIEVEVWHGAANSWLIVYTLDHGRLVPMRYDAQRTHFVKAKVYELASEQMLTRLPKDWPQVKRLDVASCGGVTVAQ